MIIFLSIMFHSMISRKVGSVRNIIYLKMQSVVVSGNHGLDQWFPTVGAAKRCQGCRQILNYSHFNDILLHKVLQNCHFNHLGVPPNFFIDLRGAVNQKRLKNTELDNKLNYNTDFSKWYVITAFTQIHSKQYIQAFG